MTGVTCRLVLWWKFVEDAKRLLLFVMLKSFGCFVTWIKGKCNKSILESGEKEKDEDDNDIGLCIFVWDSDVMNRRSRMCSWVRDVCLVRDFIVCKKGIKVYGSRRYTFKMWIKVVMLVGWVYGLVLGNVWVSWDIRNGDGVAGFSLGITVGVFNFD